VLKNQLPRHIAGGTLLAALVLVTGGCSSSQPTPTETSTAKPSPAGPYENLLIRRPGSTTEDGKVYVVQNGKKRWVVNASWFSSHGFKFPDDVREVPSAEFDAIPAGEPIQ
jgi:hypothetical protein